MSIELSGLQTRGIVECNLCRTPLGPHQEPRWHKDGFDIYKCRNCGLIFRGNLPSREQLRTIYAQSYFLNEDKTKADGYADYLGDETEHRLIARRRIKQLNELTPAGKLLDVGAAAGFFLDEARRAGWDVQGIDISPETTEWGRANLGLELTTGLFQDAEYEPASFDAVTMWDYIEHSVDPAADLSKAADVLRPGGILMLSTGDAATMVARLSGERWHLLTPHHHNFFFTADTLRHYLSDRGFEITRIGHPGAYYSLRYLVYKLRTMFPRSSTLRRASDWLAGHALGERQIPFNLGDIATIHAIRR